MDYPIYEVTCVETIAGDVKSNDKTFSDEDEALAYANEQSTAYVKKLDAPEMRSVGGSVDIFVEKSSYTGREVIMHTTIKRPLHSPKAAVFLRK